MREWWKEHWGADFMIVHGRSYRLDELDGFMAREAGERTGLVTFTIEAWTCEILSLDSLRPGQGSGSALLRAVEEAARRAGCRTLALTTTNDNTHALRFYQKYGFQLTALHAGAVSASRRLKPSIPEFGQDGIPIRDEIDLELPLAPPNPDLCT